MATHVDDGSYDVTWTVHIALAVPRGKEKAMDVHAATETEKAQKKKRVLSEAAKSQGCYHLEYTLPGGTDAVKVDLIVFGPVAKIYKDDEMTILRLQRDGERSWIGWTQTFSIRVDRDTIINLLSQKIKLQIWNSKNKISSRAWANRYVAFRLPNSQAEDATECAALIGRKAKETGSQKPTIDAFDLANMKRDGTASVEISAVRLLAGETIMTDSFPICSCGVYEVVYSISLDKPLLSDQLNAELNPLIITILAATSLPSSPVPFHVLEENCLPVYCQYKLLDLETHRTSDHKHGATVRFDDVNVVLVGLMSSVDLLELLTGPPLEMEVHDRDRKSANPPKSPAAFDERSNAAASRTCSTRNLFKQETNGLNSYGVASINLSELLLGKKSLKLDLQIKRCPPPQILDRRRRMAACGSSTDLMPEGHYFDSKLKVRIEISRPLNVKNDIHELHLYDCPFGRIIYLFAYNNVSVMTKLRLEILRINAAAFNLSSHSQELIEEVLPQYKMNSKQRKSKDLDFVSGFHVLDKKVQIFVLEGLKHEAVRRLWENVPTKQSGSEDEQVVVLYNSSLGFVKRIYDSLNVGLTPIHLCESLETIMRQPLVYIRHMLPRSCFQALSRLNQLREVKQLKYALLYDLLPSADMVLAMSKEYGVAPRHIKETTKHQEDTPSPPPLPSKQRVPLDTHNTGYIQRKQRRLLQTTDFVQDNIRKVQEASEQLQRAEVLLKLEHSTERPAHKYSIQTFICNEQAKELLLKEMEKAPGRRFTYSQKYHDATVEPRDMRSKHSCRSSVPAVWTTSINCKSQDRPDEAREEELRKPWSEKVLHANTLKPTLTRDTWACSKRSQDFQLYSKLPPFFGAAPVTIHLAGDRLHQEQLDAAVAQSRRWLKNAMRGNSPAPEFKCHMAKRAGKLQDILKDEPKKYSLRRPGMVLQPFPDLSVLRFGEDYAEEKEKTAQARRPFTERHLSGKNNSIPWRDPPYKKGNCDSFLYKQAALPLTEEEMNIFAFQSCSTKAETRKSVSRPFRKIMEVRTYKDTTWFAQ